MHKNMYVSSYFVKVIVTGFWFKRLDTRLKIIYTIFNMAGHSKWANIKYKKAAEDRRRGKIFSKISRNIRAAVREGGSGDPENNANLRVWLDKAREANMPKNNIQRAIHAGLGKGENGPMQEVIYEGFGPNGIGMLIITLSDNKNRTTAEVRNVLNKAGGSLGSPGSVKYMFSRNENNEYECTIPLEPQNEQHLQQIKKLIDNLLELEDVEDVYCAIPSLNEESRGS